MCIRDRVRNAAGTVLGRLDGSGNVVNSAGSIVLRGFSSGGSLGGGSIGGAVSGGASSIGGAVSGATGGASAGGFTVRADGSVTNASGVVIGRVDGSGNITDAAGRVIGRVTGG